MAIKFDYKSIFEDNTWTVVYDNAEGKSSEFYKIVKSEFEASNYPNLDIQQIEIDTKMAFFAAGDKREMVVVSAKGSAFFQYQVFFSANRMGNVMMFSCMECMKRGIFAKLAGQSGGEISALIRGKSQNLSQWEDFTALDNLSNIIFSKALVKLDPNYKEQKLLLAKGTGGK
jgi:hypothetical protein|tara:strand:+ start:153 stop:668 length:516 start_codon:yes stop_codon:yes gene_type:complete